MYKYTRNAILKSYRQLATIQWKKSHKQNESTSIPNVDISSESLERNESYGTTAQELLVQPYWCPFSFSLRTWLIKFNDGRHLLTWNKISKYFHKKRTTVSRILVASSLFVGILCIIPTVVYGNTERQPKLTFFWATASTGPRYFIFSIYSRPVLSQNIPSTLWSSIIRAYDIYINSFISQSA